VSFKMTKTERELADVGDEIGAIAETNSHWFAGLAALVESSGKRVDDMTVGELRSLITQRSDTYNRIYADFEGRQEVATCQI